MSRVILWRHGNTDWNRDRRIQGQTDSPINELGLQQADAAAPRIAALKPTLLISSDLSRATSTAAALATITGLPVERDQRLRERSFGVWETLTMDEVALRYPAAALRWKLGNLLPDDGPELAEDLGKRVAEAIRHAADRVDGGTAVLVTHGGSVKWGITTLLDWPHSLAEKLRGMDNCHWAELVLDDTRGWILAAYNVGV